MPELAVARPADELDTERDRRRSDRFVTIFRVGKVTRFTGDELCMLRNMSEGGAMANVASPFEIGEQVTLDMRLDEQIIARVVWVHDSVIGLSFINPIDLSAVLAAPAPVGLRPRAPRLTIAAQGKLQVDREAYGVVTTDVSQNGAKLFVGLPMAPGSPASLWLDGLDQRAGVIRWSANGMIGLSFHRPIKIWELTSWAKSQRNQPEPIGLVANGALDMNVER